MENNTGSAEHYYQQSILQGYVFSGHEQQNCAIQGLINLKLSLINNTNSAPEDSVQFQITDNHSSSMGLNSLDSGENSESLTVERLENFLNHAAELFELPEAMRYFNELESTHKFN
ncbi:MAG: hypothetical protein HWD59_07155 [Coxiellaceae bacterium]|nr:MAG: hypothetical protein HWD59_07155 [Coxiellaceae bacterium]